MKISTLRTAMGTIAVRQDDETYREISGFTDAGQLLRSPNWRDLAEGASGQAFPVASAELAPVIPHPGKIICVGLNYRTHIKEMGRELPEYPTLFAKFPETLVGPTDMIELPDEETAVDWEAELAVIIGQAGRRIPEEVAANYVAGYSIGNDVSMRSWQYRTNEWTQGKNWERSTPLGPTLVTKDAWQRDATIRTVIDGKIMQEASTSDLVHTPEFLIAYISTMVTLNPGDVILTGTPGGVGHGQKPPRYISDGEMVETSIEGIGRLMNKAQKRNHSVTGNEDLERQLA